MTANPLSFRAERSAAEESLGMACRTADGSSPERCFDSAFGSAQHDIPHFMSRKVESA